MIFKNSLKRFLNYFGLYAFPRDFLFKYIRANSVGADIGVWKGDFSKRVLSTVTLTKYYLIDPWAVQPEFKERMFGGDVAKSQEDMDAIFAQVNTDLAKYSSVSFLRSFSDAAASELADSELDWVYIDENHYYDYVVKDLELYFPKVKIGGYIIGDDYNWRPNKSGYREVRKAVNDFVKGRGDFEFVEIKNGQYVLERIS